MYKAVFAPEFFKTLKLERYTFAEIWYEVLPVKINYENPKNSLALIPEYGDNYFKLHWFRANESKLWIFTWKEEWHYQIILRIDDVRKEAEFVAIIEGKELPDPESFKILLGNQAGNRYKLKINLAFLMQLPWCTIYRETALNKLLAGIDLNNPEKNTSWLYDDTKRTGQTHYRRFSIPNLLSAHHHGKPACFEAILFIDDKEKTVEVFSATGTTIFPDYKTPTLDEIFEELNWFKDSPYSVNWKGKFVLPPRPSTLV